MDNTIDDTITQLEEVYNGLLKLTRRTFPNYPNAIDLLTKVSEIALPNIDRSKHMDLIVKLLQQPPTFFSNRNNINPFELKKLVENPPANELCLRLLINFRDIANILYCISYRHILYISDEIPPGSTESQVAFMTTLAAIFKSITLPQLERIKGTLSATQQNFQAIQLGKLCKVIPQTHLFTCTKLFQLTLDELVSLQSWLVKYMNDDVRFTQIIKLFQIDTQSLNELKANLAGDSYEQSTIMKTSPFIKDESPSAAVQDHSQTADSSNDLNFFSSSNSSGVNPLTLSGVLALPSGSVELSDLKFLNQSYDSWPNSFSDIDLDNLFPTGVDPGALGGTEDGGVPHPVSSVNDLSNSLSHSPFSQRDLPLFPPPPSHSSPLIPLSSPLSIPSHTNGNTFISPLVSGQPPSFSHSSNFVLRISKQPPQKLVYQRITRPYPMVMLESGEDKDKNLYIEASLIRSDNEDEIKNSALEGTKMVRISNGTFATFKKLKIMTTSQMQGSFFRLKFRLKRYNGKEFHDDGAFIISNPIEVFSHSQYITPKKGAPPPPVVQEVLPPVGAAGCRVVILGTNFVNSPKLRVKFGESVIVPTFHEQGTLICTTPPHAPGSCKVRVANDSVHFDNSNSAHANFTYR